MPFCYLPAATTLLAVIRTNPGLPANRSSIAYQFFLPLCHCYYLNKVVRTNHSFYCDFHPDGTILQYGNFRRIVGTGVKFSVIIKIAPDFIKASGIRDIHEFFIIKILGQQAFMTPPLDGSNMILYKSVSSLKVPSAWTEYLLRLTPMWQLFQDGRCYTHGRDIAGIIFLCIRIRLRSDLRRNFNILIV